MTAQRMSYALKRLIQNQWNFTKKSNDALGLQGMEGTS
jgi:hypothetical protein